MDRPVFIRRILDWLRAGYPNGVPQGDYVPLVALLRRQLTEDEVEEVAAELTEEAPAPSEPISKIDAGVKISKVTHELPHETDIARVRTHLEAQGWPFDDTPLARPGTDAPDTPAEPRRPDDIDQSDQPDDTDRPDKGDS
ncbi:hypothetical protein GCM10009624_01050 [Gordonia sinesedis]